MGDFFNSLFGSIGDIAGEILADLENFFVWLFSLVLYVANVLAGWIQVIAQAVFSALQAIAKFFAAIWNTFFKSLWQRLVKILKSSQVWNDIRHGHILAALIDLRKLLDQLYNAFLRPIMVLLQRVRLFLQLLKLLHINIAAKLDAYIAQLENQINQAFLTIRAALNTTIDIVNILADPSLLLRKPQLLISLRRQIPALIRAVTGKPPGYWFPSPRGTAGGAYAPVGAAFNFADPTQNPPASALLNGDDGGGEYPTIDPNSGIPTFSVDSWAPLDFFRDDLYPLPACTDPVVCLNAAFQTLVKGTTNG